MAEPDLSVVAQRSSSRGLLHIDELQDRSPGPCYNVSGTSSHAPRQDALMVYPELSTVSTVSRQSSSRGLLHIDQLQNRSPGPCYNVLGIPTARQALVAERQNEFIRKGIEREAKLSRAAVVRTKEKEAHDKRIMDKQIVDVGKMRQKLAQQESKVKVVRRQNKSKQVRVMLHKQKEVARLSSERERLLLEEKIREKNTRQQKTQHQAALLSTGIQRERKLQEAANQRARDKELLESSIAIKHAAEEDRMRRRLEVAYVVRQSLECAHSSPEVACSSGNASKGLTQCSTPGTTNPAHSVNGVVETQQVEVSVPSHPSSTHEYSPCCMNEEMSSTRIHKKGRELLEKRIADRQVDQEDDKMTRSLEVASAVRNALERSHSSPGQSLAYRSGTAWNCRRGLHKGSTECSTGTTTPGSSRLGSDAAQSVDDVPWAWVQSVTSSCPASARECSPRPPVEGMSSTRIHKKGRELLEKRIANKEEDTRTRSLEVLCAVRNSPECAHSSSGVGCTRGTAWSDPQRPQEIPQASLRAAADTDGRQPSSERDVPATVKDCSLCEVDDVETLIEGMVEVSRGKKSSTRFVRLSKFAIEYFGVEEDERKVPRGRVCLDDISNFTHSQGSFTIKVMGREVKFRPADVGTMKNWVKEVRGLLKEA